MVENLGNLFQWLIFLGVALRSGLQRVILPFIDRGIPVEYELVRSISTVAQQKRKKIGVVQTDAQLYGGFNMQTMSSGGNWPIIDELEKQYELVQVDATNPIGEEYDVLLAVQPSSLGPQQMDNFLAAVQSGRPAAIFEDPFPAMAGNVPATSAPRQSPNMGMPFMMQQQQGQPKGDIAKLWQLLGVDFAADKIVWQDYNPYRKAASFPKEFVFVDDAIAKAPNQKMRRQLWEDLLLNLARDLVRYRPNRQEPRAVKRRPKPYPLLNQPRRRFVEIPHRNRCWKGGPRKYRNLI